MSLRRHGLDVRTCLCLLNRAVSCVALLLIYLAGSALSAQGTNATINGQITDPSGRVVPETQVEAVNIDTNAVYPSKSNSSGIYVVSGMLPGRYRLMVMKDGFKVINKTDITLHIQDILEQNFSLEVGSSSESVTVEGDSQNINTTDASVSTVVDRKFVENIPLNGRSFQDLISMTPGVVTQSPQSQTSTGNQGDFSVNGQRTEANYYAVDGVSANTSAGFASGYGQSATGGTIAASTTLGTTQALLSVDALQEFRVLSSTYSAEFGRTPGGQFSFATRSGTNSVHGSAFDYLRNNFFDANNWFNDHYGTAQPALRQNDFGGTVGGPIVVPKLWDGRNKSFFFVSYEGLRLTLPQAASLFYVPSLSLRQTAAASLQPILSAFPIPTGAEATIACNNITYTCPVGQPVGTQVGSGYSPFIRPYALPNRVDSISVRLDQALSPRLSTFFRFGDTPSTSFTRSLSNVVDSHSSILTYTFGVNSQLTSSLGDELRVGYTASEADGIYSLDDFGGATPTNLAQNMGVGGYASAFPEFYLYINGLGSANIETESTGQRSNQWNIVDNLSLAARRHQFKFGVDYRRVVAPLYPTSPSVFAEYTSSASIVAGSAALVSISKFSAPTPIFNETALFAQDDWRLARALSLSMGIRWELDPPLGKANGHLPYTLLGSLANPSSLSVAPADTPLWHTTYYNFAPRLGIAWTARSNPGWEAVVRAGGGAYFDTDNQFSTQGFRGLGFNAANTLYGSPLPATASELNFNITVSAPYRGTAIYGFPSHLQLPYSLQWNAALEQGLGKSQSMTLSYVASSGRRLLGEQLMSVAAANPNLAATIYYFSGNLTSSYQSLQAKLQRSISHGIQALASYTWSHSIDYGSSGQSLPFTRGSSDYDVRNNFQTGLSCDIGGTHRTPWVSELIDHWNLDGRVLSRSGFPITLTGSLFINPQGQYYYGGLNFSPGVPIYLYSAQYAGGRRLNPASFVSNSSATSNGNVPRNLFRGFGATQINMAIRREFPLHGDLKLQFRAETFNALNHPIFGYVDPALSDSTFGEATKTLNQSLGTVASQYQQGGPRSMQFALKLLF